MINRMGKRVIERSWLTSGKFFSATQINVLPYIL